MTTSAKVLLVVVGGGILLMAATVAAGAAAVYSSGTITVDVEERDGGGVSVHVPAALANLALAMVPDHLVEKAIQNVSEEIEPYLPGLRDAWAEFERAPDFVMVEVRGHDELLRVEKRAGKLIVTVDSGGDDLRVEVPLRTLHKIVNKF